MRRAFADHEARTVYLTDHPSVAAHLRVRGAEQVPLSVGRHYTMQPDRHPQGRGYAYALLNGNYR